MFIYIIIALVFASIGYHFGNKKGLNEGSKVCDECVDELLARGYQMGRTDAEAFYEAQAQASLASAKTPKPKATKKKK